mgnify:CR=1 FL=1
MRFKAQFSPFTVKLAVGLKIELGLLVNFCAYPNVDIVRMAGTHFLRADGFIEDS